MAEETTRPAPGPRPGPPKPPRPPVDCAKCTAEIAHLRAEHPNLPPEAFGGIWILLTHGECGPLPPT